MDSAQQFANLINDYSISQAEKEVFRRSRQLTRSINTNARDMDPLESDAYFKEILQILENELKKWAKSFSPEQWLWYLRRVPEPVLSGQLASTFGYDISLAEVYSSYSTSKYHGKHIADSKITFPVTEDHVKHVLKFCRMVRQISRVHTNLRYSGKGVGFKFVDTKDFLPHPNESEEIEEAIRLFDQRAEISKMGFSRTGTVVVENLKNWSLTNIPITIVHRLASPQLGPDLWQIIQQETPIRQLWYRFVPVCIALDKLADLVNRGEISKIEWFSKDFFSLIALQRMMMYLMTKSQAIHQSVRQVGYSVHSYNNLCIDERNIYKQMLGDLKVSFPNSQFPESMKEALDHSMLISVQTHPLKHGPVIRKSDDMIFIDWYSMTHQLDYLLEFPKVQGDAANQRGDHFELSVQSVINKTSWRPKPNLLILRRRGLKYTENNQEKFITDIDAIGEKDKTLLIVSCKATIYSSDYDIGDYRTVRNQASNLQNYVDEWENKKQLLATHMIGDNYNFSSYSRIIAVVCTPFPVYVPIGKATSEETGGLRKAVSVDELERWLDQVDG